VSLANFREKMLKEEMLEMQSENAASITQASSNK